jgi:hypothetical protein
MLESIRGGAVLKHKRVIIAAVAVTSLMMIGAFPYTVPASADHLAINVDRDIEIPCHPSCAPENEPEDLDFEAGGTTHTQVTFTFVPREINEQ